MAARSYYEVLGVPRDASVSDIKKAYRALARLHHPDVSSGDESFSPISEAYATLGDPDKRREYDLHDTPQLDPLRPFVQEFLIPYTSPSFSSSPSPSSSATLPVLKINLTTSLKDAYMGAMVTARIRVPAMRKADPSCRWCAGTGQRTDNSSGFPSVVKCDCNDASGGMEEVELEVAIPRRTRNGDTITIDNPENIPYRRVIITVHVEDSNLYRRQGAGLVHDLRISTLELAVGVKKKVPFFDQWVILDIPAGTSPQARFDITHDTFPGVTIKVKVDAFTPVLDEDHRAALEALIADTGTRTRSG